MGAAVSFAGNRKRLKYARLLAIARAQHNRRLRASLPEFGAFVISTLGELAPDVIVVQEFLLACYARKLRREGERRDGYTKKVLTAQFRTKMRIGLQVAVARGCAQMSINAGLPYFKKRKPAAGKHSIAKSPRKPRKSGTTPKGKGTRPKSSHSKGNKPQSPIPIPNQPRTPAPARTQPKTLDETPRVSGPSPRTLADFLQHND